MGETEPENVRKKFIYFTGLEAVGSLLQQVRFKLESMWHEKPEQRWHGRNTCHLALRRADGQEFILGYVVSLRPSWAT